MTRARSCLDRWRLPESSPGAGDIGANTTEELRELEVFGVDEDGHLRPGFIRAGVRTPETLGNRLIGLAERR